MDEKGAILEKIDHIGIVVKDLDKAIRVFSEALGLTVRTIQVLEEYQAKIAFLPIGESFIELCQPIGPGEDQDFLTEHGEGLQHICFEVKNIDKTLEEIGRKVELRDKKPRLGAEGSRIAFLDPQSVFNIEIELAERKKS